MWSEARKQEKKIRGIMVDYRKRADRRKEFYERIVSVLRFCLGFFEILIICFKSYDSEQIQYHSYNYMEGR